MGWGKKAWLHVLHLRKLVRNWDENKFVMDYVCAVNVVL
jgi:hypothetical protein